MAAADDRATFAIEVRDETSGAADAAAGALERLRGIIDQDVAKLRQMQAAMRNLKGGTVTNVAAFRALQDRIAAMKASIASAQQKYIELGGSFDKTKPKIDAATKATGSAKSGLDGLLASAGKVPGPLGQIAQKLAGLGVGGPVAIILAVAVAMAALVVAVGAATVALVRYGLAQADARRADLLRLEGIASLHGSMATMAVRAGEAQAAIDSVSRTSALGREQITGMAEGLSRAGLRGAALSDTLQTLALIEQVQGAEQARLMRGRLLADARAGRSAERLAATQARLGGIAKRQALGLGVQMAHLRENFDRLFDTLKIDGFLEALSSVTELFSQSSETGRALRTLVEVLVQPLINQLRVAMPLARRFFQGMVIGALLATIAVLQLRNWLFRTFGEPEILKKIDFLRVALIGGVFVVGLLVVAVAALATMLAIAVLPMVVIGVAIWGWVQAAIRLTRTLYQLGAAIAAIDWVAVGRSIVVGLVTGIQNGASRLVEAVRGLGHTARAALESALDIGSPSRVFAELGVQIPAGLAMGIERGTPLAADAVADMGTGTAQHLGAATGSPTSISVGDVHVYVQGGDGQQIAGSIVDELVRLLEGAAIHQGAPT